MRQRPYTQHLPELLVVQRGRCYYCDIAMQHNGCARDAYYRATVDHKVPRSKGGSNHRDNLVAACLRCNQRKADMSFVEFLGIQGAETTPLYACPFCGTEMNQHEHCFSHPKPAKGDCILRHYSFSDKAGWNTRT